ncbi:hypothetical protein D3C80_1668510 [compost metagenome]
MHNLHSSLYLAYPADRTAATGLNPVQIQLEPYGSSITFVNQHIHSGNAVKAFKFKIMIMINELQPMLLLQYAGYFRSLTDKAAVALPAGLILCRQ